MNKHAFRLIALFLTTILFAGGGGGCCGLLASSVTSASADSTGAESNVSFTIPITVPLAIKSDGTVISQDSSSWRIENTGSAPITLDSVTASGMRDGTIISFATSSTPVYGVNSSYGELPKAEALLFVSQFIPYI